MKKFILSLISLLLLAFEVQAQQAVASSGGDAASSAGSVNYTIGQIDYVYAAGTTGSFNQGVQQPNLSSSVPVTMLDLKATKQQAKVILDWSTATESNSSHFIVEHSSNGIEYDQLNRVQAAGNSSTLRQYTSNDEHPYTGWNYYRIKEVDLDGKVMYSKVAAVAFDKTTTAVVYPNPTSGDVTLNMTNSSNSFLSYALYDAEGRLLLTSAISGDKTIIHTASLAPATYVLKFTDKKSELQSLKIIKTK